ncbi:HNH endonuclease [Sedimenticola selenatireducens]|uniref:HNH endonuclease n=1 Tax=Sedimenticola selenatireducens TaxID=191960 RepID=UPI002AAC1BED|nr:HNH endonuclease [Sedimenticola selenatireducens]
MTIETTHILKLDVSGLPISLIKWDTAAHLIAKGKVIWFMGETAITLHGGHNHHGEQSILEVPSIISVKDRSNIWNQKHPRRASRYVIYARDEGLCMYCGDLVSPNTFEIDHILPKSRGGADTYQNLCCACGSCNLRKRDRTPEEAGMQLLAVPYVPNPATRLILSGRAVIANQMDYLREFANLRHSIKGQKKQHFQDH